MKRLMMILAAVAAMTAAAEDVDSIEAANAEAIAQMFQQALDKCDAAAQERCEDEAIVKAVYGEGTNSSFITRAELTATQKRFIALGRRLMYLAFYAQQLERRVEFLEQRIEEQDEPKVIRVRQARPQRDSDDKVRRAVERASKKVKKGAK